MYCHPFRLRLTDAYTDLKVFKYIDDSILKLIETSDKENLSEARNIIRRIKTREWYDFIMPNVEDVVSRK